MSREEPAPGPADFLFAARSALQLLGEIEVLHGWTEPSALPQMSVGALAAHLGDQVLLVHDAVTTGAMVVQEQPISLLEHYARVPWVGADLDQAANAAIRQESDQHAAAGHGALVRTVQDAVADLRTAFTSTLPQGLPPAIRMPRWDWSLSFEDYLTTRAMEIVVHSDDLAVSVGIEPPTLPEPVLGPVLALLVGVSLHRHGQAAVVRALSRSERAPDSISAL